MAENKQLKDALLTAYGMIRQQTEQICDLHLLFVPLIHALDPKYSRVRLGEAYLREQVIRLDGLSRSKTDSLALVDEAIRRLKAL
jgi:hypothetical protein